MQEYPKEQLWELYENLPKELQRAIFSDKNADLIYEICFRNNVKDDDLIPKIAKAVNYVLLGLLPPNELMQVLEKELDNVSQKQLKQIILEINGFVFLPVKEILESLYNIEMGSKELKKEEEKGKNLLKKKDKYREPVE